MTSSPRGSITCSTSGRRSTSPRRRPTGTTCGARAIVSTPASRSGCASSTLPGTATTRSWRPSRALEGARHALTRATAVSLADFVLRWREDMTTWNERFERLPRRERLVEALAYLGLHEAWILTG